MKNIFIVDDDEMLSMMLADDLGRNPNYTITTFSTGEECLESMYLNPDVVILDFNLNTINPDAANGLHILQQIKQLNRNTNVIMYSSQEQYGVAVQTIGKGALQYVIKDQGAFAKIKAILREL